ncbi:MAG: BtaA family protein [Planctomycetota bacterium]
MPELSAPPAPTEGNGRLRRAGRRIGSTIRKPFKAVSRAGFDFLHPRILIYNQCWEDPRTDRHALNIGPDDVVTVITSAGCNALAYALDGPKAVHAVDMNPNQNALLELKQAAIRTLDHADTFALFGKGGSPRWREMYRDALRDRLSVDSRTIWDRQQSFFEGKGRRPSFYFRGSSGTFAWLVNVYIDKIAKLRPVIDELLAAETVDEQREIYERHNLKEVFWKRMLKWMLKRDATLAMLGVPQPQRRILDQGYPGGIVQFVVDRVNEVFTRLPIHDNYFWRVYLTGSYSETCCPDYLSAEGFEKLRDGLVDRVTPHTMTTTEFFDAAEDPITRFILLDHMDWLSVGKRKAWLRDEWRSIVGAAAPNARLLWRSAGLKVDFIDPIELPVDGETKRVGDLLTYHPDLAKELDAVDRVNTYGSSYVADFTGRACD